MYHRFGFDDGSSNRAASPTVSAEWLREMRSVNAVQTAPWKLLMMHGAARSGYFRVATIWELDG